MIISYFMPCRIALLSLLVLIVVQISEGYTFSALLKNSRAFAAILADGKVGTWGLSIGGGEAPAGLSRVKNIFASWWAFAALHEDSTVTAWGHAGVGGIAPAGLRNVSVVYSNTHAFVALKNDGTCVAWGSYGNGGGNIPAGLANVKIISSTWNAFAALHTDGSVTSWGNSAFGGSGPAGGLTGVKTVYSSYSAFVALHTDGTITAWGASDRGGNNTVPSSLTNVRAVYSNTRAFCAVHEDLTVSTCWGQSSNGGTAPSGGLSNVRAIYSAAMTFAALHLDGTVTCWGPALYGGTAPLGLGNVAVIYSTGHAYAALHFDNTVTAWGSPQHGGSGMPAGLGSVKAIYSTYEAFAALKFDGSVSSWGNSDFGGTVPAGLGDKVVRDIYPGNNGFAAVHSDGTVTAWGDPSMQGNNTIPSRLANVRTVFGSLTYNSDSTCAMRAPGSLECSSCEGGKYAKYYMGPPETSCTVCTAGTYSEKAATSCTDCAAGKFSGTGASSCTSCAAGKYTDAPGSSECVSCPAGRYSGIGTSSCTECAAGTVSEVSATRCDACPAGTYEVTSSNICKLCTAGTYTPANRATSCIDCPAGRYVTTDGATACIACEKGKYCSFPGAALAANCVDCPEGKHSYDQGSTNCNGCGRGKYMLKDQGVITCKKCQKGKYSDGGTEFCFNCEPGRYSNSHGFSLCTMCSPGRYTGTGVYGSSSCNFDCPAGRFSPNAGSDTISDCQQCTRGTYQFLNGSSTCIPCSPGSYTGSEGMKTCSLCPLNTYTGVFGSSSCAQCDTGQITSSAGSISCADPVACQAGQFSIDGFIPCSLCPPGSTSQKITESTSCVSCPIGKISRSAGQATCQLCGDTSIPNEQQNDCVPCGANQVPHHDEPTGNSTCLSCAMSQQAVRGECTDLFKCGPGETSKTGYGPYCNGCPQGRYSSVAGTKTGECSQAPHGTYAENNGNVSPQQCANGQYTLKEGSTSADACLECDITANMVPNLLKSGCVGCVGGEYATADGQCLKDTAMSNQNAIAGVFANEGTPFYIMVIVVLLITVLSVMVHNSKHGNETVLQLPMGEHMGKFALSTAGMISELILCVGVLSSGLPSVQAYGMLLLVSRSVVSVPPGAMLMYAIFCSSKFVDEATGVKNFRYYLDTVKVTKNAKTYLMVIILALFEPPLLSFLPWYSTEFSQASGFPSSRLMQMTYFFKFLQLTMTLTAQIGLLIAQKGHTDNASGALIIINLVFTCISAFIKSGEIFLKYSVLMGADMKDDCEAARDSASGAAAGTLDGEITVEFGNLYTDRSSTTKTVLSSCHPSDPMMYTTNPMVLSSSSRPAAAPSEDETGKLLEAMQQQLNTEKEERVKLGKLYEELSVKISL